MQLVYLNLLYTRDFIGFNLSLYIYCFTVMKDPVKRMEMVKLAQRMVTNFSECISYAAKGWISVSPSNENVRVMLRLVADDPGRPGGALMCGTTTCCLPVSPKTLMDFLRNANTRSQV